MTVVNEPTPINTDVLKKQHEGRHATTAGRIVEQAKENGDPDLLASALDTLLMDAEAEAIEGKLTSAEGKTYTRKELIDGLVGFAKLAREDIDAGDLDSLNESLGVVTNGGKLRSAMDTLIHDETTGIHLLDALDRLRLRDREHQRTLKKELGQDATAQVMTNAAEFQAVRDQSVAAEAAPSDEYAFLFADSETEVAMEQARRREADAVAAEAARIAALPGLQRQAADRESWENNNYRASKGLE